MTEPYIAVGVFLLLGTVFVAGTFAASWVLRPHHPHPEKLATYECGERPAGRAWSQFRVVYAKFALSFVIFDVEVIFLIPWVVVYRDYIGEGLGLYALLVMGFFLAVLLAGWIWELCRGAYQWE